MKGFNEKVDPADIDTDATDADIKSADKNIIMQMRKVVSLRGGFEVEFLDGKKQKIDPKIALAVQSKFQKLKKPNDKEKFMTKVAKSYKDMLNALKEGLDEKKEKPPVFKGTPAEIKKQMKDWKKKHDKLKIGEGTWTLPDTPKQKAQLKKVMKKPIILGKDGDDAVEIMYGLIGDDGLLDDLHNAGEEDPKGDARPLVRKYMKKFGIKEDTILDRIDQKIKENKNG